ncbi:MAG: FAD-dependent oxidoreductase [Chloroflexi bacterium]|nr:FAD-dependent oxidoreductase [Chloroflexota bacterium]
MWLSNSPSYVKRLAQTAAPVWEAEKKGVVAMQNGPSIKTIIEPAREIKVFREADVVVVGGGPGGHSAAVAAARNGANTVLVERYGYLGGMATGGLVTHFSHLSDGTDEQQLAGLCQEWLDRLDARGGAVHPRKEDLGSSDKELVDYWRGKIRTSVCREGRITLCADIDPEILKCVLNDMAEEAGVKLLLHSWGTRAIVDKNQVQGVVFESKSGRQAILAKVIIDATGDGDLLPSAGAEFNTTIDVHLRLQNSALTFRIGNVDIEKFAKFRKSEPEKHAELARQVIREGGIPWFSRASFDSVWTIEPSIVHFNNNVPGFNILDVEDLTALEVYMRRRMIMTYDLLKKQVPGFESSFIMLTAPQLGTRGSRRLIGEYTLTQADIWAGTIFEDTIAVCPDIAYLVSPEHPHRHIPYRSLVPRGVENLLVAGRCYSSEDRVNNEVNRIPHCIAMGQAAGTAAALAIKHGVKLRDIDYRELHNSLLAQGVVLPDIEKTPAKANAAEFEKARNW